jgi:hypothetical protein
MIKNKRPLSWLGACIVSIPALLILSGMANAVQDNTKLPDGLEIAEKINSRSFGKGFTERVRLELISKQGKVRNYQLLSYRRFKPDATHLVYYALSPPRDKHTAFLCYDYFDGSRQDDQWLYTPARKKSRRIPETGRSEDFLGSEFSVEDIKKINRIEINEYQWKILEAKTINGRLVYLVEQIPVSPTLAVSIGYSRIVNHVDAEHGIRTKIDFWDTDANHLKTLEARGIFRRNGMWAVKQIIALNHKTGNRSILHTQSIDYNTPVPDDVFTLRNIEKEIMN